MNSIHKHDTPGMYWIWNKDYQVFELTNTIEAATCKCGITLA